MGRDILLALSEIDALHEALFGFRPTKQGRAYERLTAVVLAVFGWTDVQHDTREGLEGKRAKHRLDVTARHPNWADQAPDRGVQGLGQEGREGHPRRQLAQTPSTEAATTFAACTSKPAQVLTCAMVHLHKCGGPKPNSSALTRDNLCAGADRTNGHMV
jgi:hypothetical protein